MANKKTIGELVYEIRGDASNFNTVIKKTDETAAGFGKNSKKSFGDVDQAIAKTTGTASSLRGMLASVAGAISVGLITAFFGSAVKEAENQQVADEKLANALANVKTARQGDFEMLKQQSSALQEVTRFSDDNIGASQALLATFQLNGRAIAQLTPRLLDMSEALSQNAEGSLDLQGATIAIGKAMTSGIGVLSRYGVTFTEAQKKMFELGNETVKLDTLTQVLDDNFKGTAETVGKTFAGRVQILKNKFGELKEDIGFALMPTLEALVGTIDENTKGMTGNQDRINTWGKAIYQGSMFIKALALAIRLVITIIPAIIDNFVSMGDVVVGIAKDLFGSWKNFADLMKNVGAGIAKVFTGDIAGASAEFKKAMDVNLKNTREAMDRSLEKQVGWRAEFQSQFDGLGAAMVEAVDAKGYKPISAAAVSSYKNMKNAGDDFAAGTGKSSNKAKEELEKLAKGLADVKDESIDLAKKGTDAMDEMKSKYVDDLAAIEVKITDLRKALADLKDEYDKGIASEDKSIAERIVEEKVAIEELKKTLTEAQRQEKPDTAKIAEMQAEIDKRQAALNATQPLQTELAPQITEATRRSGLTDLQRQIEDYQARKIQNALDYEDKRKKLADELLLEEQNKAALIELNTKAQAEITRIINDGNKRFKDLSDNRVKMVEEEVKKQIAWYDKLADAIAKSKAAKKVSDLPQYSVGGYVPGGGEVHAGEYVIPANMVAKYGGLVKELEGIRTGTSNQSTVNNNITMNNAINEQIDMDAALKNMAFELNK